MDHCEPQSEELSSSSVGWEEDMSVNEYHGINDLLMPSLSVHFLPDFVQAISAADPSDDIPSSIEHESEVINCFYKSH